MSKSTLWRVCYTAQLLSCFDSWQSEDCIPADSSVHGISAGMSRGRHFPDLPTQQLNTCLPVLAKGFFSTEPPGNQSKENNFGAFVL